MPGLSVSVLGGGSWGTTIAHLLGENGHDVLLWMRAEDACRELNEEHTNRRYLDLLPVSPRVRATTELGAAARHAQVIFVVVPLKALREVAYGLGHAVGGDHILVSCAKGLERGSHRRPSEILKEETCAKKVGVLSGPNLAREIMEEKPCATVVASRFAEVTDRVTEAIMGPRFRVYASDDVVGVELAGALKNIYALAAGLCDGLGYGANAKAALLTRGLWEMTRYAVACGAKQLTMAGLAGVGDLMATCGSNLSRNHQVGARLASGEPLAAILATLGQTAEGVNTTAVIHQHAREVGCEMPITAGMHGILFEGHTPVEAVRALMGRPARFEHAGLGA